MYTEQSVIAFAKWWYGTEADGVFKGQVNVSVEQGFEWWKNNRAAELEESAPSASTNSAMVQLLREARGHLCKLQGHGDLTSRIDVVLAQQHQ